MIALIFKSSPKSVNGYANCEYLERQHESVGESRDARALKNCLERVSRASRRAAAVRQTLENKARAHSWLFRGYLANS